MPPRPTPAGDIPVPRSIKKALTQVSKQGRVQAVVSTRRISRESAHTQGRRRELEGDRNDDEDVNQDKSLNSGPSNSNSDPPNSGSSNSSFPSNFGCVTCVVRDNDARLLYQGPWSLDGNPSVTTHSTNSPGSSVSFKFNGEDNLDLPPSLPFLR